MAGDICLDWRVAMSDLKLTDREWSAFYIRDYFEFIRGNQNNMAKCKVGYIPLISAKKVDNGYKDFIAPNNKSLFPKHILTLNNDGDGGVGIAYYQPVASALDTHVTALLPKIELSRHTLLFVARNITHQRDKFSHGYSLNNDRLRAQKILLPVNSDDLPDWQFMEDFIKQKEQKQIADLKDYYADKAVELMISTGSLKNTQWREFSFSDIFIEVKRGKRLTKGNQQSGETPYVSSTAANNGVDNFIGNSKGIRTFENCLTLANSGSVGSTFFHHYTFVASDHVTALILEKPNKYIYLFLSGIIRRLEEKYSFNREINDKRIQREKILLPVNSDGLPDWQFMEDFMKQIERDKIAAVLSYYFNNSLNNNSLRGGG